MLQHARFMLSRSFSLSLSTRSATSPDLVVVSSSHSHSTCEVLGLREKMHDGVFRRQFFFGMATLASRGGATAEIASSSLPTFSRWYFSIRGQPISFLHIQKRAATKLKKTRKRKLLTPSCKHGHFAPHPSNVVQFMSKHK